MADCESAKPKPISILHLVLAKLSSLAWRIQRWRKQLGSCLFCLACTRSSNLMKTFAFCNYFALFCWLLLAFCARKNINIIMYIMHECKEILKKYLKGRRDKIERKMLSCHTGKVQARMPIPGLHKPAR